MLTKAWTTLLALTALSAAAALLLPGLGAAGWTAPTAILLFAWLKARVVLSRYLGLAAVPSVARGFGVVLALFMLAAGGLTLAADAGARPAVAAPAQN
ncbi:hypothetical protein Rumeso_02449 [Rubellimicrobium mesophilum DSM 19309]|uniref:Nitric oxide reductase F protein n=1 Tax=Rubellimicrobium mesophilum DSM 19309 TaxID=442562 RepID=A0A017HNZ5_9RHOB|nr:hypothetical protein [Rubellimicrobium mesophilum]EYD76020.1 hypothetical protein Rumeso_02449 [Rubellimicrobium mesophilum DSM 19309]